MEFKRTNERKCNCSGRRAVKRERREKIERKTKSCPDKEKLKRDCPSKPL